MTSTIEFLRTALTISASSATATAVINHFATRKRSRRVENVVRLVAVSGGTRQSVIRVLRRLELNGFGQFISGRRGRESRFVWRRV